MYQQVRDTSWRCFKWKAKSIWMPPGFISLQWEVVILQGVWVDVWVLSYTWIQPCFGTDDEEVVGCCWSGWRAPAQGQAFWGSHLVILNLSKYPLAKLLWADLALEKTSEYFWRGWNVSRFCLEGIQISMLILPALSDASDAFRFCDT